MAPPCQVRVPIDSDGDIIIARQKGRALAAELGFSPTDVVRIATAISELARNVLSYAATRRDSARGAEQPEPVWNRHRGQRSRSGDRRRRAGHAGCLFHVGRAWAWASRRSPPDGRIQDRIDRRSGDDGLGDEMVSTVNDALRRVGDARRRSRADIAIRATSSASVPSTIAR